LDSNGYDFTIEHDFDSLYGARNINKLLSIGDTILYSTAPYGDYDGDGSVDGVLFSFNLRTKSYEVKHRFKQIDGWDQSQLCIGIDGKLYGFGT
jgi:hypothetical protein